MLIKKIMSYNNYEKDENTWYDKMTIPILNEQALCLDRTVDPWTIYSCDDPKFKARRGRRDGPVISNRVDYGRRSCSSQFQRDKHRLSQTVSNLGTVGRKILFLYKQQHWVVFCLGYLKVGRCPTMLNRGFNGFCCDITTVIVTSQSKDFHDVFTNHPTR